MIHFSKIRKDSRRITPNMEQGAWICYRLKLAGSSQKELAGRIGVTQQMVQQVAYGLKTSQRVQKAIAESLGYSTWAELIANSRRVAA
jgi:transcriptional regulator with XRE-family HTH domain